MGRGRQKAKQAKVARELKYQSIQTDFAALERELHHPASTDPGHSRDNSDDEIAQPRDHG